MCPNTLVQHRDVAVTDAIRGLQIAEPIGGIQRGISRALHRRNRGPLNLVMEMVVPEDVAHILAQVALDALAEFLDPIDLALLHRQVPSAASGLRG